MEVEALEDVVPLVVSTKPRLETLEKALVVAVSDLVSIQVCLVCNRGNLVPDDNAYGHCSECAATMLLKSCTTKTSTKLTIRANCFTYNLRADGVHLAGIALVEKVEDVTKLSFLMAEECTVVYTSKMEVVDVSSCGPSVSKLPAVSG